MALQKPPRGPVVDPRSGQPTSPYLIWFNSLVENPALATTATRLETARLLNGVPFDGSADVTIPVPAEGIDAAVLTSGLIPEERFPPVFRGILTGTALPATIVDSSLTSVAVLVGGATGVGFTVALDDSTITGTLDAARLPPEVPLTDAPVVLDDSLEVGTSLQVGTGFGCNGMAPQVPVVTAGPLTAYAGGANGLAVAADMEALVVLVELMHQALIDNGILS